MVVKNCAQWSGDMEVITSTNFIQHNLNLDFVWVQILFAAVNLWEWFWPEKKGY